MQNIHTPCSRAFTHTEIRKDGKKEEMAERESMLAF
jgi:hypothetical protein